MGAASNVQTDFRGGEWSGFAQGRMDDKEYSRALNVCYNAMPIEEGAWTRRPGTRWIAYTNAGAYAWLATFAFEATDPYVMEFTDSVLRFIAKNGVLVMTNDPQTVTIDASNPAVVTTATNHGWNTNDVVQFLFSNVVDSTAAGILMNRQFIITKISNTTFSIADAVTLASVDGSTFTAPAGLLAGRILALASPYTIDQLPSVRTVQAEILSNNVLSGQVVCLHNAVAPQAVSTTSLDTANAFAQFALGAITFKDGPYFDPPSGLTVNAITPGAKTGTISITGFPSSTFVSTDVGRLVRIFSEPLNWASGTAYVAGNIVKYTDGNYYTCVTANTGKAPNAYPTFWSLSPEAAVWAWGTITSVDSATSIHLALDASQPLLYTTAFTTFRLGVYSATTGYPSCGVFHEGRLWLAGAQGNRIDSSVSNDPFNMAPTAPDGTVSDSNAISYVLNAPDVSTIYWMEPDHMGIIAGTISGEWLISASALNDPLTPTDIQAHRVSKYKVANAMPARAGFGLLFIKAHLKRLIEYTADVFSQKFLGRNVAEKVQHITATNMQQLIYQQDLTPNAWIRMADGSFASMLYRRDSSFTSEPPAFTGWARHALGSTGLLQSVAVGPNDDGTLDTVFSCVLDPVTGFYHTEFLTDTFEVSNTLAQAWFVDGGMPSTQAVENTAKTQVTFYGFTPYIGRTISLWVGGLDLGDYLVTSDGSVTITLGGVAQSASAGLGLPLFTDAFLQTWIGKNTTVYDTSVIQKFVQPSVSLGVQSYIDNSTLGNSSTADAIYSPSTNEIVEFVVGNSSSDGIKVFDLTSGLMKRSIAATAIGPSGIDVNSGPKTLDSDGNMYFYTSAAVAKIALSTLTFISSWGTGGLIPGSMAALKLGSTQYLLMTANVGGQMTLLNASTMTKIAGPSLGLGGLHGITGVCAGPSSSVGKFSSAAFYGVGGVNIAATNPLQIYTIETNGVMTQTGTIAPTDIDATWTNTQSISEPVYDRTDGNIIFMVSTTDSVTNKYYILKVNPLTAAIIWKTALTATNVNPFSGQWNQSNIQYGTLSWMTGGNYFQCTTSNGAVTVTAITGFSMVSAGFWDDATGYLYGNSSGTNLGTGGGRPANLNSTPATYTGQWARLGGVTSPPGSSEITIGVPILPAVAGFTYTSQGQRLRQVNNDDAGTMVGPGFAKTKRIHKAGFFFAGTPPQAVYTGASFTGILRPTQFYNITIPLAVNQLFTGVMRQEIDDFYDFDGMLCWQITRPYPATVVACGEFRATEDLNSRSTNG